jgi:cytochrome c-type biogenesis protein CcmH
MSRKKPAFSFLKTWLQVSALCLLVLFAAGATDPASRFNDLGHKLMCSCGCGQVLLECNHIGCTYLVSEQSELKAGLARGDSDGLILDAFVQKYGPTILSSPTRGGFDDVAWIVPPVVFLLATLGAVFLIRRWRLRTVAAPDIPATTAVEKDALRDRIRKDTEEF